MKTTPPRFAHMISPRYTGAKIEPPFFRDLVDVFDDRMRGWLIEPAKRLLQSSDGYMAGVALATTYFEGIEHYISGLEDGASSKVLFRRAFEAVFKLPEVEAMRIAIADAMYRSVRCGFAHEALPGMGIYVADTRKEAIFITWPKKNGQFDPKGQLQSAVINPHHFVRGIEAHLQRYVRRLRSNESGVAKDKFLATVKAQWGLDNEPRYVHMSAEDFFGGAPVKAD
jgi:hypothetical protein